MKSSHLSSLDPKSYLKYFYVLYYFLISWLKPILVGYAYILNIQVLLSNATGVQNHFDIKIQVHSTSLFLHASSSSN